MLPLLVMLAAKLTVLFRAAPVIPWRPPSIVPVL
jgi:hypothetical protein